MLDSETAKSKRAAAVLQGQRIIVLGACCGFGRSMVRALGAAGAQVVAVDESAEALAQIDGGISLMLKGAPEEALRRIGRKWGEARLDNVLNLMPLRHPEKIDMNVAVLRGVVQGFMPALSARQGQIVTVAARPQQPLDVAAGAMVPALVSAQAAFAHALRRDGLSLNLISIGEGTVTPARAVVVGLLARSLGGMTGSELRL
jgi:NADP-dependent 3-hydroxy acid dehydrogenase YdfG